MDNLFHKEFYCGAITHDGGICVESSVYVVTDEGGKLLSVPCEEHAPFSIPDGQSAMVICVGRINA